MIPRLIKSLFGGPRPSSNRVPEPSRRHWISNPWHAVSIVPGPRACPAVRSLNRVRFLSKDAPALPLGTCSAKACSCHYRHHQDRRGSPRRGEDVLASKAYWAGKERRNAHGRRVTDA